MIQFVTSLFTTSTMLLHSVLGCSWHHVHVPECAFHSEGIHAASSAGDATNPMRSAGHLYAHPLHGMEAAIADEPEEPHSPSAPCQDERCTYVLSTVIKPAAPLVDACIGILPVAALCATAGSDSIACDRIPADNSTASRVRLRTQVWQL